MAAPRPIRPPVTGSVLKNSISRHNACRWTRRHFRSAFSPTIASPSRRSFSAIERILLSAGAEALILSSPETSPVFHLGAKYLARRWSEGEKRRVRGDARGGGGRGAGRRRERKGRPERAFPGVRTKDATPDRFRGTRAERKRVLGMVELCEEGERERKARNRFRRGAPVFSNFRAHEGSGFVSPSRSSLFSAKVCRNGKGYRGHRLCSLTWTESVGIISFTRIVKRLSLANYVAFDNHRDL